MYLFFSFEKMFNIYNIKSMRFIDFKNSSTSIESIQNHYYFNWSMSMYWVNRLLIFEIQLKKIHILWSMSNCWAVWTLYKMRFRFQSFFLHIFWSDILCESKQFLRIEHETMKLLIALWFVNHWSVYGWFFYYLSIRKIDKKLCNDKMWWLYFKSFKSIDRISSEWAVYFVWI